MFLRHARVTRLAAAYVLFTVALVVMVPKADIPETLFDEANTPTNEMIVGKAACSLEYLQQSVTLFVPTVLAQSRMFRIPSSSICAGELTDSRSLRELFCTLLC
jgi:hypothetical protein